jgi:hypothetical protein
MQVNIDATIDPMRQSDENFEELKPTNKRGVRRLLPIFWIDQEIDITEIVIKKFRTPIFFLQYEKYVTIPLAIVLSAIIIVIIELVAKRSAKNVRDSRGTYIRAETTVQY